MEWIPESAWFTHLALQTEAENVVYDLSVGVGDIPPSYVDAGFTRFEPTLDQLHAMGLEETQPPWWELTSLAVIAVAGGLVGGLFVAGRRQ